MAGRFGKRCIVSPPVQLNQEGDAGLGSSGENLLMVPHTSIKTRGDGSFKAVVPPSLDSLPLSLRLLDPVDDFQKLGPTDSVSAAKTSFHFIEYLYFLFLSPFYSLLVFYYIFISVKHFVTAVCEKCCVNKVYLLTNLIPFLKRVDRKRVTKAVFF